MYFSSLLEGQNASIVRIMALVIFVGIDWMGCLGVCCWEVRQLLVAIEEILQ